MTENAWPRSKNQTLIFRSISHTPDREKPLYDFYQVQVQPERHLAMSRTYNGLENRIRTTCLDKWEIVGVSVLLQCACGYLFNINLNWNKFGTFQFTGIS